MTRDLAEDEGAKEVHAAAAAVMSDAADEGRHLLLCQEADGTYVMRGKLSREGAANLLRLLAAVEDVVDRNERADAQEQPDAVIVDR